MSNEEDKTKVLSDITQFSKESLKKASCSEGNNAVTGLHLINPNFLHLYLFVILIGLAMEQTLAGVTKFSKEKLTHVETTEKNTLPTLEGW